MKDLLLKFTDRGILAVRFIINIFYKLVFLYMPLNTANMIDSAIEGKAHEFYKFAKIEMALFLTSLLIYVLSDYIAGILDARTFLSFSKYVKEKNDLLSREDEYSEDGFGLIINQYYDMVKPFFYSVPMNLIFESVHLILLFIIMFKLNFSIGLLTFIVVPIGVLLSLYTGRFLDVPTQDAQEENDRLKTYLYDSYKLRHQDSSSGQLSEFQNSAHSYYVARKRKEKLEAIINNVFLYGSMNFVISLVTIFAAYKIMVGAISVGVLTAFTFYVSQAWSPIEFLITTRGQYVSTKPAIKFFTNFLEKTNLKTFDRSVDSIEFLNYVSLDENRKPLHRGINFNLESGKAYVVYGPNGSGKTTLVESLMGLTDRYNGEILINNEAIGRKLLTDCIYIPGNAYISSVGRLREWVNGSFGQKKFKQLEFYLSKEKSIIIVDEPTNFLDSENKKRVLDLIDKRDGTILIVVSNDPEVFSNPKFIQIELICD